jgi:hypothetical protein
MMGSTKFALAAGSVLLAGSQLVFAGEVIQAPQSKVRNSPYSKLFQPSEIKPPSADAAAASEKGKPRVVCGMTVIPIDPNLDPKIRIVPQQSDTRHTIRAITPPVCK